MSYLNSYTAPPPLGLRDWHADTPLEEYDQNFVFALPPTGTLETEGVRLEPLVPSLHAPRLFQLFTACPGGMTFLPYGPFPTYTSFLTFLEVGRRQSNRLIFTVYDLGLEFDSKDSTVDEGERLRPERIAGIVGLMTTPHFRMAELGPLHLADQFQRTHVLTHSVWLLLDWMFSSPFAPPTVAPPPIASSTSETEAQTQTIPPAPTATRGLGLRRAQWGAEHTNFASINGALRIGFSNESPFITWERPLRHESKAGRLEVPGFVKRDPEWREWEEKNVGGGRHSALLGMGWDDWHAASSTGEEGDAEEEGKKRGQRDRVWAMIQRGVVRRRADAVPGLLS